MPKKFENTTEELPRRRSVSLLSGSREFTPRERIRIKDSGSSEMLDSVVTLEEPLKITPESWAVVEITSPDASIAPYNHYVIMDASGKKYETGSTSFWGSFISIWDEMCETGESFDIEVYKRESKNYKGKCFINCSLL